VGRAASRASVSTGLKESSNATMASSERQVITPRNRSRRVGTGIKITDAQLATPDPKPDNFHGAWNYTVLPTRRRT